MYISNYMKKYGKLLLLAGLTLTSVSCHRDELDDESIFDTAAPERNEFDNWLLKNYVAPYNIEFIYKWRDLDSNLSYDLVPATTEQSFKLARVVKYVWIESYDEVAGIGFMRTYVPKQIVAVGSSAYNADTQSVTLGTADNGLKVTLYNVNNIDNYLENPEQMTTSYFHIMHHEFSHILHQTRPYNPDFSRITEADYIGSEWSEYTDAEANRKGFVTAYARENDEEDFAEIIATYITRDEAAWQALLDRSGKEGADLIVRKFEIVKSYLLQSWNIDIEQLRSVVLRRTKEIPQIDWSNI